MATPKLRIPLPNEPVVDRATLLMIRTWYDFLRSATKAQTLDTDYANDAAAAAGGVPLYGLYRSSGAVKVRMT